MNMEIILSNKKTKRKKIDGIITPDKISFCSSLIAIIFMMIIQVQNAISKKISLHKYMSEEYTKEDTQRIRRQLCAYGEYFSDPVNKCLSCDGSCRSTCAYQSICMQCNSSQFFDLTSFSCINSCDTTSSILISDSQLAISSVCRGFNYYIDPKSTAVNELGTLQYPFKYLGLVFVEILNFHANSARTINIYLKENTQNYIDLSFSYIINITSVNISPYSTISSTPSKATIVAGEANSLNQANIAAYFSNGTLFNILLNTNLSKN